MVPLLSWGNIFIFFTRKHNKLVNTKFKNKRPDPSCLRWNLIYLSQASTFRAKYKTAAYNSEFTITLTRFVSIAFRNYQAQSFDRGVADSQFKRSITIVKPTVYRPLVRQNLNMRVFCHNEKHITERQYFLVINIARLLSRIPKQNQTFDTELVRSLYFSTYTYLQLCLTGLYRSCASAIILSCDCSCNSSQWSVFYYTNLTILRFSGILNKIREIGES